MISNNQNTILIVHRKATQNHTMGTSVVVAHVPTNNIKIDGIGMEFGTSIVSDIGNKLRGIVNSATTVFGVAVENEFSAALQYKRTKHPTISMALEFFNDGGGAKEDVMKPVCRLLAMAVPELESMLSVNIPGPTLAEAIMRKMSKVKSSIDEFNLSVVNNQGSYSTVMEGNVMSGENISLSVGTYFEIGTVMIESISGLSFSSAIDVDGYPVHATVNVTFRPFLNMYRGDMFRALKMDEAKDKFYV